MYEETTTRTAVQNNTDDVPRATMSALGHHQEQMMAAHERDMNAHREKQATRREMGRDADDFDYFLVEDGFGTDDHYPFAVVRVDAEVGLIEKAVAEKTGTTTDGQSMHEFHTARSFQFYTGGSPSALHTELKQNALPLQRLESGRFTTVDAEVDT